jgi:hypothetical protein
MVCKSINIKISLRAYQCDCSKFAHVSFKIYYLLADIEFDLDTNNYGSSELVVMVVI